jgi:hypothetical protein
VSWVASLTGAAADVIAIDGKTLRRSYQKKGAKAPIHMVSAFATRQRLVLGQGRTTPCASPACTAGGITSTYRPGRAVPGLERTARQ